MTSLEGSFNLLLDKAVPKIFLFLVNLTSKNLPGNQVKNEAMKKNPKNFVVVFSWKYGPKLTRICMRNKHITWYGLIDETRKR